MGQGVENRNILNTGALKAAPACWAAAKDRRQQLVATGGKEVEWGGSKVRLVVLASEKSCRDKRQQEVGMGS